MSSLTLPDGRTLAYADCGAPDGTPVIFHHGTPGSRLFAALLDDSVSEAGVRVVVPDRPGYGRSDPVDPAEASLADGRADVEALADHLDFDSFGVASFSGGGPFALACGDLNRVDRVSAGFGAHTRTEYGSIRSARDPREPGARSVPLGFRRARRSSTRHRRRAVHRS